MPQAYDADVRLSATSGKLLEHLPDRTRATEIGQRLGATTGLEALHAVHGGAVHEEPLAAVVVQQHPKRAEEAAPAVDDMLGACTVELQ